VNTGSVTIIIYCEHWFSDNHDLFKGMDNILPVFITFVLQFVGGESADDFHKEELSDCEYSEQQHSKSHISLTDGKHFLSLLNTREPHLTL
jgi:hypothetical protein